MRIGARIGGAAFCRSLIGGVLDRGLAAPALVRAASVALPVVSNLEPHGSGARLPHDLRLALGIGVGAGE